jgi:site-specific recombinase XerD
VIAKLVNNGLPVLLTKFIKSRRQGTSPRTLQFYESCLKPFVTDYELTPESINQFLSDLTCGNAKHAYYRALRAFCNWASKTDYIKDNPIVKVDPPKVKRTILPSLTPRQVEYLIKSADNLRDKCIISLFADSGMRLSELAGVTVKDIDLDDYTVTIWGKGDKQRKAPFTYRTAKLLKRLIAKRKYGSAIWELEPRGIEIMLQRLGESTSMICNPHTFRRTFASNLHKAGMDIEHIMRLGGWSSLDMVLTYTRSVKFEDSLKLYHSIQSR